MLALETDRPTVPYIWHSNTSPLTSVASIFALDAIYMYLHSLFYNLFFSLSFRAVDIWPCPIELLLVSYFTLFFFRAKLILECTLNTINLTRFPPITVVQSSAARMEKIDYE